MSRQNLSSSSQYNKLSRGDCWAGRWRYALGHWVPVAVSAMVAAVVLWPTAAHAQKTYNPLHPEVRQLVDLAVGYIKGNGGGQRGDTIIQALAVMNSYLDDDGAWQQDEVVLRGLRQALAMVDIYRGEMGNFEGNNVRNVPTNNHELHRLYEPCVALMMLVEYDSELYTKEIEDVIAFIVKRQMPAGGWTYNFTQTGDTSQTQYCCLALWIAHEKGFDVPMERSERAARFWLTGQGGNGSWGYQIVPGQRINGDRLSLGAAGAGSLYMLGDIMGVNPPQKAKVATEDGSLELPGFVERVLLEEAMRLATKASDQVTANVDVAAFNASKARANQWLASSYSMNPDAWPYYALYGFERYASFREKIDGSVPEIPDWYDQGIEFIKQTQRSDGSFPGVQDAGAATQAALAVLFMVRSTERLTRAVRDAKLKAGRGLGDNLSTRNGRVISQDQTKDLAAVLNDLGNKELSPEELMDLASSIRDGSLKNVKGKATAQQLTLLREMVTDERPLVRTIAVRALGQARLVDNCPALIFALTDPNPEVVQEASIALQYVSRKSDVPPVPKAGERELEDGRIDYATDSPAYRQGIKTLYQYWADWYLELKPNAELFPVDLDD